MKDVFVIYPKILNNVTGKTVYKIFIYRVEKNAPVKIKSVRIIIANVFFLMIKY
jgi:hypothetical protein